MILQIQDPKYPDAPSLHESLLEACQGAVSGGGAFAFVSKEGAELFLADKVFIETAQTSPFDLIVGIDQITTVAALNTLSRMSRELPRLRVRVFHHDFTGALFHPKFCWFRYQAHGCLVIGSGNLTPRGLRGNWEAFTVLQLNLKQTTEIERTWREWTRFHNAWLKPADDAQVLARAALNVRQPVRRTVGGAQTMDEVTDEENVVGALQPTEAVLVAEIGAGARWKQANFPLAIFENFFGMRQGEAERRVLLQHVAADGTLGEFENRPGVPVKSRNYRIELGAGTGLRYPARGRPIGVFVRLAPRAFRYLLLLPADPHYNVVRNFLIANWHGPKRELPRIITDVSTLRRAWTAAPLWHVG